LKEQVAVETQSAGCWRIQSEKDDEGEDFGRTLYVIVAEKE
jgi:hypothetical protein